MAVATDGLGAGLTAGASGLPRAGWYAYQAAALAANDALNQFAAGGRICWTEVAFTAGVGGAGFAAGGAISGLASSAAMGTPFAERLFTSRLAGVASGLLGHSFARGSSGVLNRTGSIVKVGWTSSGEFGGGWHLRVGLLPNPANANQALRHIDFGSTHAPNDVANRLLSTIRQLRGVA